jgi:hypothetical protein
MLSIFINGNIIEFGISLKSRLNMMEFEMIWITVLINVIERRMLIFMFVHFFRKMW